MKHDPPVDISRQKKIIKTTKNIPTVPPKLPPDPPLPLTQSVKLQPETAASLRLLINIPEPLPATKTNINPKKKKT
jgi:hypothetical protein